MLQNRHLFKIRDPRQMCAGLRSRRPRLPLTNHRAQSRDYPSRLGNKVNTPPPKHFAALQQQRSAKPAQKFKGSASNRPHPTFPCSVCTRLATVEDATLPPLAIKNDSGLVCAFFNSLNWGILPPTGLQLQSGINWLLE